MWRKSNAAVGAGLLFGNGVSAATLWVQFPPSALYRADWVWDFDLK